MSDLSAVLVHGARKVYPAEIGGKPRTAVDRVDLEVLAGTVHGLLGRNGAGKTTTLKMLLGLVRPTAGEFLVNGVPSAKREAREKLGYLPEQPYFPSHLTAAQLLLLHGRLAGFPDAVTKARTPGLLDRVGLGGRADDKLASFSRGMLQRVGLAQALVSSPEVLVLDEPASGLDPIGQRDIRNLMSELRSEGTTILLSSHQLSEVEAVCDRVTIVATGRVAAEGSLDELLRADGSTSVRVRGVVSLPDSIRPLVLDVALAGETSVFSVRDEDVRKVVDAVDDAGGTVESVAPKRDSLEDYFAALVGSPAEGDTTVEEVA